MTTTNYPGDPAGAASGDKREQAKEVAGTAADQSKHVADVAKGEAQYVAGEAKYQVKNVMGDARMQVDEQSRTQRDRLVETMRTFSDDLEQMASQGGREGMATDVARQVAGKARDWSSQLEGREPSELLDEVRNYARRKPGAFLLGALVAGVVAGRVTRGAKEAQSDTSSTYDQPRGTATGAPLTGTGVPPTSPVYPAGAGTGVTGSAPQGTDPLLDPGYGAGTGMPPTGTGAHTDQPLSGRPSGRI